MKKWFKDKNRKKAVMTVAAALIVFVTTYSLILPALTVEKQTASEAGIVLEQEAENQAEAEEKNIKKATAGNGAQETSVTEENTSDRDASGDTEAAAESTATTDSPADEEGSAAADKTDADAIDMPEQSFEKELKKENITVSVKAQEGALPANTEMKVEAVSDKKIIDKITEAAEKEAGKDTQLGDIQAVDISFWSDGKEIEPAKKIDVTIASSLIEKNGTDPIIVHINDEDSDKVSAGKKGKAEIVTALSEKELKKKDITPADDEVVFEAEQFSVYAIVGTETLTTQVITANGDTYTISVTYGPEAEIPKDATLEADEIPVGSDEYEKYYKETSNALGNTSGLTFARFFDIRIVVDGQTIEPAATVETKIEYDNEVNIVENTMAAAVHFGENGIEIIPVEPNDPEFATEFVFQQDSYSVSGTVVTELSDGPYLIYARTAKSTYYSMTHSYSNRQYLIGSESGSGGYGTYTGTTDANVVWNVTAVNGGYQISATYGTTTRYLTNNNGTLQWGTTATTWAYSNNKLNNGNYYLRWNNNAFSLTNNSANASDIYFAWTNSEHNTDLTVHYGYMSGGEFVEWDSQTVSNPTYLGQQIDLLGNYESNVPDGYRYVTTRVSDAVDGTEIYTKLQTECAVTNHADYKGAISSVRYWKYRELDDITFNYVDAGWNVFRTFADEEKDIYVIYEPKPSSTTPGGDDIGDLDAPDASKNVSSNGDGTYQVALSVTGESRQSARSIGANVVIVYDVSWSMDTTVPGTSHDRKYYAESTIKSIAQQLLNLDTAENPDLIELAFVGFAARVVNEKQINNIYSYGDYSSFASVIDDITYTSGTNWDAGLEAANNIQWKDNDPLYVIMISDGDTISRSLEMTAYSEWDGGTYAYGTTGDNLRAAVIQANKLKNDLGATIYGVGAFGDNMENLASITSSGEYVNAMSPQTLQDELDKIVSNIISSVSYENIAVNDGITNLSSTALVTGDVSDFNYYRKGGEDENENEKYSSTANNGKGEEWTDAPEAYYLEIKSATEVYKGGDLVTDTEEAQALVDKYGVGTKTVVWDLQEDDIEDGVTYTVTFTVWPSQAAYDLIADLNNKLIYYSYEAYEADGGTKTEAEAIAEGLIITDAERNQVNDLGNYKYSLKTNTAASVDYTSKKTIDGDTTETSGSAPITDPNYAMSLDTQTISVEKIWKNWLDSRSDTDISGLQLVLTKDGDDYLDVNLPDGDSWVKDGIYISCGLISNGVIKETGHDYQMSEKAGEISDTTGYWDITSPIYHPMVDGNTVKMLVKSDRSDYDYYLENYGYYKVDDSATTMSATNERLSWLNLTKVVTDTSNDGADPDAFFTYTITFNEANENNVYFSVFGDGVSYMDGLNAKTVDGDYRYGEAKTNATETKLTDSGRERTYYYIASESELTLSIKAGWSIRFLNLATGTTYTITESDMPDGFEYTGATNVETLYNGRGSDGTRTVAEGYPKTTTYDGDRSTVSGTINQTNTDYTITYTNLWSTAPYVYIQKMNDSYTTSLAGSKFTLNKQVSTWIKVDDYTVDETVTVSGTEYTNVSWLGNIGVNDYQLIETKSPAGYVKLVSGQEFSVTKTQGVWDVSVGDDVNLVKGTITNDDGTFDAFIIQIPNTEGSALPNTGGSGTLPYTLSGLALIVFAASMFGFRMRRRERRLN